MHAEIARLFRPSLTFRPGLEIGLGEITTLLNINLDVLYAFPGYTSDTRWIPYAGAGPAFGLSHKGVSTEDVDDPDVTEEDKNRFDFSDTDFNGGMNFIFGVRKQNNVFVEMKATAWGVSNIRLLVGFNFGLSRGGPMTARDLLFSSTGRAACSATRATRRRP